LYAVVKKYSAVMCVKFYYTEEHNIQSYNVELMHVVEQTIYNI